MKLLHRPTAPVTTEPCWLCHEGSTGPMCAEHGRQVRAAAHAQSQPGYRTGAGAR